MWNKIAHIVLKYRIYFIILLALYTAFMGYHGRKIEMNYDFSQVVPSDDKDMIYFQQFKKTFGEDGNLLAIGIQDSTLYKLENFRRFKYFSDEVARLSGTNDVLSLPRIGRIVKNTEKQQFEFEPIFKELPETQQELDSLLELAGSIKFYEGRVVNDSTGANLMVVSIEKSILNSDKRQRLMDDIMHLGSEFSEKTGIKLHYAGLPFVRTVMSTKVKEELNFFLVLSVCVTAVILFLFFRSWRAVVFPMLVIIVVVVSTMGTVALLGYKITLLTGLLPPIIVVIGIPNCIYMLNKYHQEYARHRDKMGALSYIIRKIGVVTLLTNATTAVGFVVLGFTDISILREFGIVAGINIVIAFLVSIVLIPSVFAYLPAPNPKQLKHLEFKGVNKIINSIDLLVHRHPVAIYSVTGALIIFSLIGMTRLKAISYMVDDLPEESDIKTDLAFFEKHFQGVMPLEIVIDTGKKRGAMNLQNLKAIDEFEEFLNKQPDISAPVSLVTFAKASRQAFYNGSPAFYSLPTNQDKTFILQYMRNQMQTGDTTTMQNNLLDSFVDSTGQKLRVSLKVADMGSVKLDSLLNHVIRPEIARTFADTDLEVFVTGTTLLFIKGNDYLIQNLQSSLVIAFVLISLIMAALFGNIRMIIISLIPNMIPLLITAGLMGYFNIPLKPSTALIFSIAFGISVDDSIHFLAKYRQEVRQHNYFIPKAVSLSIFETGSSMFYTSIVLFAGFIIFAWSDFGGTVALGLLTSTTLLCAMLTNLILLPRLLLTFDRKGSKDDFEPWIEHYEEFYTEEEDEEINVDMLALKGSKSNNSSD
jgi:predicted RND superfamily exporter protein